MQSWTVRLTPLNVPALDTQLAIDYWIGSRYIAVGEADTICANLNPSSNFCYVAPNWVEHASLWKSASQRSLVPFMNKVNLVTPAGMQTISPFFNSVRAFEISGDSQSYFSSSSEGWSRYVSGTTWAPLDIDPLWRLVPSFDGTAVCAIAPNGNSIEYITDRSVTVNITGSGSTFAAICGTLVVVGRGSFISTFGASGVLQQNRTVAGVITGVFADDTSVWVGTGAQRTYMSVDNGQNWLEITNARVVIPWLVIRDGFFFTVEQVPVSDPGFGFTSLGIPQPNASLDVEYWVGAPWRYLGAPPTVGAKNGNAFLFYNAGGAGNVVGWNSIADPWKSRHGVTIVRNISTVERLTFVQGQTKIDTLLLNAPTVSNFEISGDGSTFFLLDPNSWKVYDANDANWRIVGLAPYVQLVPSFSGSAWCGISQTDNTVKYVPNTVSPKTATVPGQGKIFAAVIGTVVIIGRGSAVFLFGSDDVLRPNRTVVGQITGVFADDTSVWIGTDAQNTYVSFNLGQEWLEITNARVVTPWLVIRDGHFFTVQYTPPNPGNPGDPGNPGNPGNPGDGNPPGTQPGDTPASSSTSTIIAIFAAVAVIAVVVGLMIFSRSRKPAL